ncbi:MAG: SDR family oxidoreductase [Hyphomonas sp.]
MKPGAAIVTGAGGRLGRAMAEALGADGWAVCVHYRGSEKGAEDTAASIRKAGGRAEVLACNLANESDRTGFVGKAAGLLDQPITLLVNSASSFSDDRALDHSREDWDAHIEPNLRAPIHLAQQLAREIPADEKGLVVNLIDQRVLRLTPQFFTYTLSKAALWQATKTMAQAFAPNIRVNGIGPGPTLKSVYQTEAEFEAETAATLTGEGSSPEEIIRALRYLISATSVTGQMIAADGGQHLLWQTPDIKI